MWGFEEDTEITEGVGPGAETAEERGHPEW